MKRADAIIGTVACGCLAFALVIGAAQTALAQQPSETSVPGSAAPAASGTEPAASSPAASSGVSAGASSQSGSSLSGSSLPGAALIDRLNQALERAISGEDGTGGLMSLAPRGTQPSRGPVVVEMFTSQGCSSCPPADESFMAYAARPDVIALSLHVDYWDYLGWEDPFAQPAFTSRQKAYARAAHSRSIYTPQMVVGGAQSLIGSDMSALDGMIAGEKARPAQVVLNVSGDDGRYVIDLGAPKPLDFPAVVQIVRYAPHARVAILRGENAGMVVDYVNVVTAWHSVADWDGRSETRLAARIDGDQPAVVIVQSVLPGKSGSLPGPILAAARLN